ncbi:MAG: DNA polymerase III subunit gamma/tau [Bacteroidia bacterium]|nr:DNA polymerase III subunit gamma/tau [Bacteroidia bacterium]
MESFVVSARKYRPGTFETVVGQGHVTNTLRNALLLKQLPHAFLFCGPRGVGKTTCARILAKSVNCSQLSNSGEPCNECESCKTFNEGRSLSIFELDAASNNGVEDIRNLIERLRVIPQQGSKSVYIIDEVHMLTTAAFNAFLKTLEEPPPHAIFILATTEKQKILPTILSRCQKFEFKRIRVNEMATYLQNIAAQENIPAEPEALHLIAQKADGALRDALSLFDQIVNFSNRNITYEMVLENLSILDYDYYFRIVDAIQNQDHETALLTLNQIVEKGFDLYYFLTGLTEHFRNLIIAQSSKTATILDFPETVTKRFMLQTSYFPGTFWLNALNLCWDSEQKYRNAANTRLHLELLLIKLVYLNQAIDVAINTVIEKKKPLNN